MTEPHRKAFPVVLIRDFSTDYFMVTESDDKVKSGDTREGKEAIKLDRTAESKDLTRETQPNSYWSKKILGQIGVNIVSSKLLDNDPTQVCLEPALYSTKQIETAHAPFFNSVDCLEPTIYPTAD